jgi:hypothetical protein
MGHSRGEISGELRLAWTAAGSILKDLGGKIKLPSITPSAGLYRFFDRIGGSRAVYVGETENLQRRFAHYRNLGPTQPTNLRINALFIEVLSEGGSIDVEIVVDRAWIRLSGTEEVADFTRKDVRRLFENFILATQRVAEIEDLNK